MFFAIKTIVQNVIFILSLGRIMKAKHADGSPILSLEPVVGGVLVLQLVALVLFMLVGIKADAMKYLIGAGYGALWWVGIVVLGTIVPMACTLKAANRGPKASVVLAALILLGGFFLRYAILFAGQLG